LSSSNINISNEAVSGHDDITRAAGVVGAATLLSRVLGLVRDLVVAFFFGADQAADAFFVAFRIPNLLRRLVAEGALTVSFIPIFTEYLRARSKTEAFEIAKSVLTLLSLLLTGVCLLGILLSPWIVWAFAPGFSADPDKFALTVLLTRIVFPYIFLVSLVALAMGILNSLGKFAGPALSPVMLNLGMIAAVLFLARFFDPPILALAVGVLIGGLLQVLLQVPYLARQPGLIGLSFNFRHPAIKRIALLMAPAAVGAAVYQFTVFINTILASFLPEGSVSYLYYADRVVQFPLGVFAVALATAVLPAMSRRAADRDLAGLADTLSFSLRLVFFITIPAVVGMILLAEPIIQLLFQRGRFDPIATRATAQALVAYAVGLWALSAVQIVVRAFYSLQDTRTPVKIAVVSLLGNVVFALLLMNPFKHVGLALASSAGSMLNLVLLVAALRRRLGPMGGRAVAVSVLKNLLWSAAMGAVVFLVASGYQLDRSVSTARMALLVGGAALSGLAVYLGLAALWRAEEIKALWAVVRRRRPERLDIHP